jgi:hypothetical protein
MPPKIKDFKPKSKTKSKVSNPESENDFLEAAEEFEQAGVSDLNSTIIVPYGIPTSQPQRDSFSCSYCSDMD